MIEDIHSSHPGTWGIICMATHCWWPYMHRELTLKATECKPCTVISKNLKSLIPATPFHPHVSCVEPNQEIQIDFGVQFLIKRVMKFTSWLPLIVFLNTLLHVFKTKPTD